MSHYERFTFRGRTLDRLTIAALLATEKKLGYVNTIIQGSYNTGVAQSAGTHDDGGAVDLIWFDIRRKNRALRGQGRFAGWPRETLPGEWSRHWHGILIGNDKASAGAKVQVVEYRNGFDGLAGEGRDHWWRPRKIRAFNYQRCALISWKRVNGIAGHRGGKAWTVQGARQVEVVAWALAGFDMNIDGHHRGRMDRPLLDAIKRFKRIRGLDDLEVDAPLTPRTCWELCIPTREES